MSVDEEEAVVRAFLQSVVLRASKERRAVDMPDLDTLDTWALMKTAAALGFNIDIVIRPGGGKVTAEWMETDE